MLLLVLLAVPVGGLVFLQLRTDDELDAVRQAVAPVLSAATARTVTGASPAAVEAEQAAGRSVAAPEWRGRVTQTFIAAGSLLTSGSGLLAIDGVVRVALVTPEPFFRPLELGDRGHDVLQLNAALVALGYLSALPNPTDSYPAATREAVRTWARDLGVRDPDGTFDPGWVIFLPAEGIEVGEVGFEVGGPAPAPGAAVAKEATRLTRAKLQSPNPSEVLTLDPAVDYVFIVNEQRFAVVAATAEIAPGDLTRLAKLIKPATGAPGQQQQRLTGVVQRVTPLQVVAVPATAVQTGASGALCVWAPGDGRTYVARTVTLAGSRTGVTNVKTGLEAGEQVLANPSEVLEQPSCPSK